MSNTKFSPADYISLQKQNAELLGILAEKNSIEYRFYREPTIKKILNEYFAMLFFNETHLDKVTMTSAEIFQKALYGRYEHSYMESILSNRMRIESIVEYGVTSFVINREQFI